MFKEIRNFYSYSENLMSSGMPNAEQFRDAANHGVQVVINLAPHDVPDALPDEAGLAASLGFEYINIPVDWNTPAKDGLDKFMDAMAANNGKKMFVHCQANFRASAFIAMYRILRLNWKEADALEPMHSIWDEDAYPVWKMFIDGILKDHRNAP
jgi:protein tyrosine phosphatase (PTP) superfamily phosphohydrolase (DUF442 family)